MSAVDLLPSFVDLLKRFSKDLHEAYGSTYPQLEPLRRSIVMFANTFPEMCAKLFHAQVTVPYAEYIEKKDQQFFVSSEFFDNVMQKVHLNESYIESLVDTRDDKANNSISDMLALIRSVWVDMDEKNRQHVWDYMTGLVFLSKRMYSRS